MSDLDDLTKECERLAGYPTLESVQDENKRLRDRVFNLLSDKQWLLDYILKSDSVKEMLIKDTSRRPQSPMVQ